MSDQPVRVGEEITAIVTKAVPFGVLVEFGGVPGLVCGVNREPGAVLQLRVVDYDTAKHRLSATAA